MGAEDFISKPFNSELLIEKINTILKNKIFKDDENPSSNAAYD